MLKPSLLVYFVVVFQTMSIFLCFFTTFTSKWVSGDTDCNSNCGLKQGLTIAGFNFTDTDVDNLATNNGSLLRNIFLFIVQDESKPKPKIEDIESSCMLHPSAIPAIEKVLPKMFSKDLVTTANPSGSSTN